MKKIYTLLLFLFIAMTPSMAQQMLVEKGGNTESIEFSNLDKITFNGTTVNIKQLNGTTSQATMGEIDRITFSNYTNIDILEYSTTALFNYISSDEIAVNCNAGEIIRIYDVIGSQIICVRQNADNATISIAQLPKGIYIIKANDRTAKFVKR